MNRQYAYRILLSVICLTALITGSGNKIVGAPGHGIYSDSTLFVYIPTLTGKTLATLINNRMAGKAILGQTQKGKNIEAWYFPGSSNKRALAIGGVHGSELSAIELAKELIDQLQKGEAPYYSVVVVPCLFRDNEEAALNQPLQIGSTNNIGRYTHNGAVDPNRQMPSLGKPFDSRTAYDHFGRVIEKENQLLLELIREFRPQRIANLHAIRDTAHAGVYADPRTDSKGIALGYETDSLLAIAMADYVHQYGGIVPGNRLEQDATALYYKDPCIAPKGFLQKRNIYSNILIKGKGHGVSLGGWASTAVEDKFDQANNRDAIRLITVEFPGCKRPKDYKTVREQNFFQHLVQLYAAAVKIIFFENYYTEEDSINSNETIVKKYRGD
jgi:hypothetical protein